MNKQCWNCNWYNAYYIKGFCNFTKESNGFCTKNKQIVDKHYICALWGNNYIRRKIRKSVSIKALAETLENFNVLKQIFEEEQKESKINPVK